MITDLRRAYNASFTQARYRAFRQDLDTAHQHPVAFRVAETPIFLPDAFRDKLLAAAADIVAVLRRPDFKDLTAGAIPPAWHVPGEDDHPQFLAIDFAVGRHGDGTLHPYLIELQGFPSLFGYQEWLSAAYRRHFAVPDTVTHRFGGLDDAAYRDALRAAVVGDEDPAHVVLLEIEPLRQKTAIDFLCTQALTGVVPVCLSAVEQSGRQLYYRRNGQRVPIRRIYNRVIADELERRPDFRPGFALTDDVDVTWAGHPNWFFRVSKFTMPFLDSPYVPPSYFLSELPSLPPDPENYVLKPLFSFAGLGVRFDVTHEELRAIPDPEHYILQRKVEYAPVVETPDGLAKAEVRLLLLWPQGEAQPRVVSNLARLSKGKMIGVDFNKDRTWVGGSVAFFGRLQS